MNRRLLNLAVFLMFYHFLSSLCMAGERFINGGGGISVIVPRLYSDLSRFYNFLRNEGPGNALGGGGPLNIDHSSFSPYLKVIYTKNYKPEKIFCWYFGMVAGVHLFTKTHPFIQNHVAQLTDSFIEDVRYLCD